MAEMKHTPGPWGFGNTVSYERLILGKGGNSGYVCHVTVEQCGGGIIAQSMEAEREANARLIAAAPDLLEAAKNFIRWAEEPADGSVGMAREQGWLEQARAAIARARGEQDGGGE